ncbi:DUF72 domain-containing protein [Arthrobacter mobilis]|uniref:DUF72 domain-containing protein n=1 Tax=Arthrobacter mobilis TaxID=2724944 RepID=UPI0028B0A924|nr:DUF72 domain-containing protein [Arthrobacter mobilis]
MDPGGGPSAGPAGAPPVLVGTSGWRYPEWRGSFYPAGLPQRLELEYAAGRLASVELNASFYGLQRPSSYQRWREATPAAFVFAVKGPRQVTHLNALRRVQVPLANFFASGVLALGAKLGPLLWQLPPRLAWDPARLEEFLALLPRGTAAAAELAARHADLPADRTWTAGEPGAGSTVPDRPLRHAVEVRHPSFANAQFYDLLRRYDTALVVADTAGRWPLLEEVTAGFMYVRLHGSEELYVSGYSDAELQAWAGKIRGWLAGTGCPDGAGRPTYVYFDNTAGARAPFDAIALASRLAGRGS